MNTEKGKNKFTVILSNYFESDTNIFIGGGTERTEEIQSILDTATKNGGLHLIVDGAYLCDTLYVSSNTTIECMNEKCGFYLKDHVTRSLISNKHCNPNGEIEDSDIHFIGGTYNFNCNNQEHHCIAPEGTDDVSMTAEYGNTGFRIFGVKNFSMENLVLRNQRTFATALGNWEYVRIENVRIDLPNILFAQNQDGLHFFGPGRFATVKNIVGCAGDDFIAFAPDELDGHSSITDVLVDGVQFDESDQGIRLLSRGKGTLDRIIIKNITGTYKSYGFFINPWINPHYKKGLRYGNYGSITLENIDVRQVGKKYDYTKPCLFRIGGIFQSLRIKDVNFVATGDSSDFMQIGGDYIFFDDRVSDCKTEIKLLKLNNIEISHTDNIDLKGVVIKKSNISRLLIDNIISDVKFITNESGEIENIDMSHIID